jgi:hypothetical protein
MLRGVPKMNDVGALVLDYRARARELRVFAGEFTNLAAKRDLMAIADQWETMADDLEGSKVGPVA